MTNEQKAVKLEEMAANREADSRGLHDLAEKLGLTELQKQKTATIAMADADAALLRECAAMMRERESVLEHTVGKVHGHDVRVCRCEGHYLPKQPYMWAVRWMGNVIGKSGDAEYEPIPSSRDDEFYAEYRFDTPATAQAAAVAWVDEQEGKP